MTPPLLELFRKFIRFDRTTRPLRTHSFSVTNSSPGLIFVEIRAKLKFWDFVVFMSGVLPSPCFSNFLARTTFVLESLPEAKNPGKDAILGDFVFNRRNS